MKRKFYFSISMENVSQKDFDYIFKLVRSHLIVAQRSKQHLIIYVRMLKHFDTLENAELYKTILKPFNPEINIEMGDYPE